MVKETVPMQQMSSGTAQIGPAIWMSLPAPMDFASLFPSSKCKLCSRYYCICRKYTFPSEIKSHCIIIYIFFQTSAVTVWTTVATVAMSWAVPMKPAVLTSLPAAMVLASQRLLPVMARTIAWTVQMRQRVCAPHRSPRVLPTITCAHQASALTPTRCAMDRRTVTITVMKRAVVSWEWHI